MASNVQLVIVRACQVPSEGISIAHIASVSLSLLLFQDLLHLAFRNGRSSPFDLSVDILNLGDAALAEVARA